MSIGAGWFVELGRAARCGSRARRLQRASLALAARRRYRKHRQKRSAKIRVRASLLSRTV